MYCNYCDDKENGKTIRFEIPQVKNKRNYGRIVIMTDFACDKCRDRAIKDNTGHGMKLLEEEME